MISGAQTSAEKEQTMNKMLNSVKAVKRQVGCNFTPGTKRNAEPYAQSMT